MKTEAIVWYEIKKRPMTPKELVDAEERCGGHIPREYTYIYEPLPSDGQEVLVCLRDFDGIQLDVFHADYGSIGFENYSLQAIKAWAEMPKGV